MSDAAGLTSAASRLVGIADEAIRFFQQLDLNTKSVTERVNQLESLSKLAKKIELETDNEDQEQLNLVKQILLYCYKVINRILSQLEWVDNGGKHTLTQQGLLGVYTELNKQEVKDLFDELQREQLCLVAFRDSKFKPLSWVLETNSRPLEYSHAFKAPESDFLHALFVTDPREDRANLESTKGPITKGTCTWITENPIYRSWLSGSGESRGLVLQGGSGTGKTMLAIYLSEQLEQLAECMSTDTVIYFFCNHGNINANSATAVLRGLIWQLCRLRPSLIHHGLEKVVSINERRIALATSSVETLWQIFTAMIRDPTAGTITCVLDGLDECDESSINILSEKFWELLSSTNINRRNFRILITGSSICEPADLPDTFTKLSLDSDNHKSNARDVRRYIKAHIKRIARDNEWDPELQKKTEESLIKANGSFLWASLVVSDLRGKAENLTASYLDELPVHVKAIYEKILFEIPRDDRKRVRSLLAWVALAYYPLSFEELNVITEDPSPNSGISIETFKAIINHCGALLVIKNETRKSGTGYETIETVQISHQSVKKYLLQPYLLPRDAAMEVSIDLFRIVPDTDHELLASRCLELMEKGLSAWSTGESNGKYALVVFRYTSRFWFRHLRECPQKLASDGLAERALTFLTQNHVNRRLWVSYLSISSAFQGDVPSPHMGTSEYGSMTNALEEVSDIIFFGPEGDYSLAPQLQALQLAALLGIPSVVRRILVSTSIITHIRQASTRSSFYGHSRSQSRSENRLTKVQRGGIPQLNTAEIVAMSPLELAVLEGHYKVASTLLELCPRSSLWPDSAFALATAISHCEEDMVKLLIDAGASKLRSSRKLDGPICTAVINRRLDVVKFLCRSEDRIWAREDSKMNEITQALLCLANDPILSTSDETAFAQYSKVLLRGGASPNGPSLDDEGRGLRYWKRATMEFLHSHGITLQALGPFPDRQTPLMLFVSSMNKASSESNPADAVQFLLDSGASINQTDLRGWSALHHVANQIALGRAKKSWGVTGEADEYKLYQIASLLIAAGIDQQLEDKEKRRAADILQVVGAPVWDRNISEYELFMRSEPLSRSLTR
ncbi:hypothetical protein F53441_5852 [Fusarium austroafricanum]|uniref:Nephrocystin 3-like N-terminal domain-containing protein n=1 Tax=Fusarium austroafricanum TaxID=2364996 RepID=A0A8H4KL13_9HYPO|nr:hypothetical protein F53441_5852 [Fusarium austroafricanum]